MSAPERGALKLSCEMNLLEEIEGEAVRLGQAEATVAPLLICQLLLDRQSLLNCSPILLIDIFRLDHDERTLGRSIIPEGETARCFSVAPPLR